MNSQSGAKPSQEMYMAFTYLSGLANPSEHTACHGEDEEDDHEGHDHGDMDGMMDDLTDEDAAAIVSEVDTTTVVGGGDVPAVTRRMLAMSADEQKWDDEFGSHYKLDTPACQDAITAAELMIFTYMGFSYDFAGHPILKNACPAGALDVSPACETAKAAYRGQMIAEAMEMMYSAGNMATFKTETWAEDLNLTDAQKEKAENKFSLSSLFAGSQYMLSTGLIAIFAALWN